MAWALRMYNVYIGELNSVKKLCLVVYYTHPTSQTERGFGFAIPPAEEPLRGTLGLARCQGETNLQSKQK
eukprot:scaffold36546_cov222-Skeletonema_dohrnii-CCMP3373.AAC.2